MQWTVWPWERIYARGFATQSCIHTTHSPQSSRGVSSPAKWSLPLLWLCNILEQCFLSFYVHNSLGRAWSSRSEWRPQILNFAQTSKWWQWFGAWTKALLDTFDALSPTKEFKIFLYEQGDRHLGEFLFKETLMNLWTSKNKKKTNHRHLSSF